MKRYWVVDAQTGVKVVKTYFANEGRAEAVAEALEAEAGGEYEVRS